MVLGARRRRPPAKGLLPGERLRRDKLAGAELYSQWGWVSRISDPSLITSDHLFSACGFNDKSGKPLCRNKYSDSDARKPEEGRVDAAQDTGSNTVAGGDDAEVIIVTSDDEELPLCNKKRCKENPQCLNYLGQVKLENQGRLGTHHT
jgi:ubiquitin carboxyl-terminal hydrolase 48